MLLYRPTGMKELELVYNSNMKVWPPRLPEQPIFYPVLNVTYAEQIARDWNTKSEYNVGYVTEFNVNDEFIKRYKKEVVGSKVHEELWIPAEELTELNQNIINHIEVIKAYFGPNFKGCPGKCGNLLNRNADEQIEILFNIYQNDKALLENEIIANNTTVYLNWLYWNNEEFFKKFERHELTIVLDAIKVFWNKFNNGVSLPDCK